MLTNNIERVKVVNNNIRNKRKDRDESDNDNNNNSGLRVFKKPRQIEHVSLNELSLEKEESKIEQTASLVSSLSPLSPLSSSSSSSSEVDLQTEQVKQMPSSLKQSKVANDTNEKRTRSESKKVSSSSSSSIKEQIKSRPSMLISKKANTVKPSSFNDIKIINKTIDITSSSSLPSSSLPSKIVDNDNVSSTSEFLSYDKIAIKTLRMQSYALVLCLSILAFIRMQFPAHGNESYLMAPYDSKFIGYKLRGSNNLLQEYNEVKLEQYNEVKLEQYNEVKLEQYNEVKLEQYNEVKLEQYNEVKLEQYNEVKLEQYNEVKADNTVTLISQKKLQQQNNISHSSDTGYDTGYYSFKGTGLGFSIGNFNASLHDDNIRVLLASYSAPITITTLITYISDDDNILNNNNDNNNDNNNNQNDDDNINDYDEDRKENHNSSRSTDDQTSIKTYFYDDYCPYADDEEPEDVVVEKRRLNKLFLRTPRTSKWFVQAKQSSIAAN